MVSIGIAAVGVAAIGMGINAIRLGEIDFSDDQKITGPSARVIGIAVVIIGVALVLGATVGLTMFRNAK